MDILALHNVISYATTVLSLLALSAAAAAHLASESHVLACHVLVTSD